MKFFLCLSALLGWVVSVSAQAKNNINVRFGAKMDTTIERVYKLPKPGKRKDNTTVIILNMPYGDSKILNPESASEISEGLCNIISVDLVYTEDENIELMEKLNKKRLFELYLLAPDVFNQSMVNWKCVKQMGYSKPSEAAKLFHGFVIHYKKTERYKPGDPKILRDDIATLSTHFRDSTVLKSISRHPEWSKELIVADFTGSMSPYYKELMAWFYLKKFEKKTTFSFFNDGDGKPDYRKTTGSTGGVYTFTTDKIDTVLYYAYQSMMNGSGGDAPENNIEAIIKGFAANPEAKEIILIADNWADMRDYSMMSFVKKPVRVILCGIESTINPQYLDLARNTKGSLHTMNEDLNELMKIREGEEIDIRGMKYVVRGGRFVRK